MGDAKRAPLTAFHLSDLGGGALEILKRLDEANAEGRDLVCPGDGIDTRRDGRGVLEFASLLAASSAQPPSQPRRGRGRPKEEGGKKALASAMFQGGADVDDVCRELQVSRATAYRYQKEFRSGCS